MLGREEYLVNCVEGKQVAPAVATAVLPRGQRLQCRHAASKCHHLKDPHSFRTEREMNGAPSGFDPRPRRRNNAIILATHGTFFRNKAGSLRDSISGRSGRNGRSVSRPRFPAGPHCGHQGPACVLLGGPDRMQRFAQEARAAAALNHPNILSIFDIGDEQGSPYVVSELLEGETLRERLQERRRFPHARRLTTRCKWRAGWRRRTRRASCIAT